MYGSEDQPLGWAVKGAEDEMDDDASVDDVLAWREIAHQSEVED